jgi:hypothetical protein
MGFLASKVAVADGEGPWSIEPNLGVSTQYTSNPLLLQIGGHSETRVAALVDLPLRYDTDEWEFLIRPNGRFTDEPGYSALGSNFEHLDGAARFNDELDSASLQAGVDRDSSLYFLGGLVNHIGVARDTDSTSADWTRSTTERSQVQLDAGWSRVHYDEPADFDQLVDYRYWSAGPTFAYSLSERNTIKLLGSYGLYQSLNGATQSTSENIQLGFTRQLSEIWLLSTSAGYSRSMNRENTVIDFFGFLFPVTERSTQNGTVYMASLTRQGERVNFTGSVSQALQPTGFAFLSRQDSYTVTGTYVRSERWDFSLSAAWLKAVNPQINSGEAEYNTEEATNRYVNINIAVNWHWTPQWVVSVKANRITQQYGPPTVSGASSGISVDFTRQFLRTHF